MTTFCSHLKECWALYTKGYRDKKKEELRQKNKEGYCSEEDQQDQNNHLDLARIKAFCGSPDFQDKLELTGFISQEKKRERNRQYQREWRKGPA